MIREFKPSYWIYNLLNRKRLKHQQALYKKYGLKKKWFTSISSQDFEHLDAPLNKYDKVDSRKVMPQDPLFKSISPAYQESLLQWSENGYAVLRNFLSAAQVAKVNQEVANLIEQKDVKFRYNGKKIMFAFRISDCIKAIGTDPQLMTILELLMGKEVKLFQSINFTQASQQRTHSDSIHMTTFPLGNLIAVWIALEDIDDENGPIHYYPGSHRLPYILNKDFDNLGSALWLGDKSYIDYEDKIEEIIKEENLEKVTFNGKAGDVFIWHANLLHGGNALVDPSRSRKSMVFHYYSKDAICYHELTQRPSLF